MTSEEDCRCMYGVAHSPVKGSASVNFGAPTLRSMDVCGFPPSARVRQLAQARAADVARLNLVLESGGSDEELHSIAGGLSAAGTRPTVFRTFRELPFSR
uniref:Uncharacterized protein n=1 Tax=Tetraselmis chuii TaxID=63592 RepID=A0A7S1X5X9_9CHLO